jgi:hypothetical protein
MATREQIQEIQTRVNASVIGQERVVERLVIALLANGNVLVEGLPGRARVLCQPHPVHARPAAARRDRRGDLSQRHIRVPPRPGVLMVLASAAEPDRAGRNLSPA